MKFMTHSFRALLCAFLFAGMFIGVAAPADDANPAAPGDPRASATSLETILPNPDHLAFAQQNRFTPNTEITVITGYDSNTHDVSGRRAPLEELSRTHPTELAKYFQVRIDFNRCIRPEGIASFILQQRIGFGTQVRIPIRKTQCATGGVNVRTIALPLGALLELDHRDTVVATLQTLFFEQELERAGVGDLARDLGLETEVRNIPDGEGRRSGSVRGFIQDGKLDILIKALKQEKEGRDLQLGREYKQRLQAEGLQGFAESHSLGDPDDVLTIQTRKERVAGTRQVDRPPLKKPIIGLIRDGHLEEVIETIRRHKAFYEGLKEVGLNNFWDAQRLTLDSNIADGGSHVSMQSYIFDNNIESGLTHLYAYARNKEYTGRSPWRYLLRRRNLQSEADDAGYESEDEDFFEGKTKSIRDAIRDCQASDVLRRVAQQRKFRRLVEQEGLSDYVQRHGISAKTKLKLVKSVERRGNQIITKYATGSIAAHLLEGSEDKILEKLKGDSRWERFKPFAIAGGAALAMWVIYACLKLSYDTAMANRKNLLTNSQEKWLWEATEKISHAQIAHGALLTKEQVATALKPLDPSEALVELFFRLQKTHYDGYPDGRTKTIGSALVLTTSYYGPGDGFSKVSLNYDESYPHKDEMNAVFTDIRDEWWQDFALPHETESFSSWLFSKKKTYKSFWRTPAQA